MVIVFALYACESPLKLDKSLLDFHIDDLDQKISKQLD